jgi:hypothetical protein
VTIAMWTAETEDNDGPLEDPKSPKLMLGTPG